MMTQRARRNVTPRPFLKWAGGKGQLLPELIRCVELAGEFGRYHEPFLGGGALFFELYRSGKLRKKAELSDNNGPLIETYEAVRADVESVVAMLEEHRVKHGEAFFYRLRAEVPRSTVARAARIIYLNKTCYNGLYRENSRGQFNTPFGRYKNPVICDAENLRAVSKALSKARITQSRFEEVLKRAVAGDFVYFDPPYHPLSKTSSFTGYDRLGFNEDSQRLLADVMRELDKKGVKVLLSNSMSPFIRELYKGFTIGEVKAARAVNSRADRRGKISEALIRNF